MKVRVLSDLHLDLNEGYVLPPSPDDCLTLIMGDISGYFSFYEDLVPTIKKGLIVAGNHVVYNDENHSLEYLIARLRKAFPLDSDVSFLENDCKRFGNTIFVGCTLWTNYELFGTESKYYVEEYAQQMMNDFVYARENFRKSDRDPSEENPDDVVPMEPCDFERRFRKSKDYIDEVCRENPDCRIVVMTHHAPSLISVPEKSRELVLAAAFANDLDGFILAHPNIKYWFHGHVHARSDYMIGDCRVVCNPLGYIDAEHTSFDPNLIIDIGDCAAVPAVMFPKS